MSDWRVINIGLFGAGRIGKVHAGNIVRHRRARLAAVYDTDPAAAETLAGERQSQVASTADILANREIEAVIIASPAETHADFIEAAARSGKAIFCEKPIDKDLARVRRVLQIVKASGAVLFMAFNRRFDPSFACLQRQLREGEVGKPEMVFLTSRDPAPPSLAYLARSGGLFRDMMIHDFDVARWLLGEEPEQVFAIGRCFADPAIAGLGLLDTAIVTLTFPSGAIVNINCAMRAAYGYDQRAEVHGAQGMLSIGNRFETSLVKSTGAGICQELPLHFFTERYAEAYVKELDHFVSCLERKVAPEPGGVDGLRALEMAEAANRSWSSGRPVAIAEIRAEAAQRSLERL